MTQTFSAPNFRNPNNSEMIHLIKKWGLKLLKELKATSYKCIRDMGSTAVFMCIWLMLVPD